MKTLEQIFAFHMILVTSAYSTQRGKSEILSDPSCFTVFLSFPKDNGVFLQLFTNICIITVNCSDNLHTQHEKRAGANRPT